MCALIIMRATTVLTAARRGSALLQLFLHVSLEHDLLMQRLELLSVLVLELVIITEVLSVVLERPISVIQAVPESKHRRYLR